MVVHIFNRLAGFNSRLAELFPDREFFMRANGQVKFLKISSRLQIRAAAIVATALLICIAAMLFAAVSQFSINAERTALTARQAEVASSESRVRQYRGSINDVAADLSKRQDALDDLTRAYFKKDTAPVSGIVGTDSGAPSADEHDASLKEAGDTAQKVSALIPEASGLAKIEARQLAYVAHLMRMADARTRAAENAIRKFGLNPTKMAALMTQNGNEAMGGPFQPFFSDKDDNALDPRFARLGRTLARMDALERSLVAIPSGEPAHVDVMTSNFGYRSDPFTGRGAMHSGIDFRGTSGQAILAAARGKVSFAGRRSGYGNCIEISHGNGLMTRYAHLRSIAVRPGQRVAKGATIGGMGSTGRSTGTHLHFEVRLNGQAINPTPFLEANLDVLKVQAVAEQRTRASTR